MSLLHSHFERIAVISLPQRAARRAALTEQLAAAGLAAPGEITWMEAVEGVLLPPPAWWRSGTGAWGCLLSHARVLQDAVRDRLENVLILEDDVIFHHRIHEWLPPFLAAVPDGWGQIYLGGQHLRPPITTSSPLVLRAGDINRTHAYAVHRCAIPRIHQHLWHAPDYMPQGNWHIDHQYGLGHRRAIWNAYAPAWWLAGQAEGDSDICGRPLDQRWWHHTNALLPLVYAPDLEMESRSRSLLHPVEPPQDGGSMVAHLMRETGAALRNNKLPLWQNPGVSAQSLRNQWPGGLHLPRSLTLDALAPLADYPANSLFPHPHNSFRLAPEFIQQPTLQLS
jgi:hypothetical protein